MRRAIDLDARGVRAGDFVVGIAASGTTPYVRVALEHARVARRAHGDRRLLAAAGGRRSPRPTSRSSPSPGPEVVTGSTRLKAGTATKLILNMITTGAMIRLGKTFGNLMVDLRATNEKLTDRSERIVAEVCDVDRERARALLAEAGGRVKLAIVMHALGVSREEAERRLEEAGGVIRRVVPDAPPPVVVMTDARGGVCVGLMSGTSLDGISAAVARFTPRRRSASAPSCSRSTCTRTRRSSASACSPRCAAARRASTVGSRWTSAAGSPTRRSRCSPRRASRAPTCARSARTGRRSGTSPATRPGRSTRRR